MSKRYTLLNELKDKITQENEFLQNQNTRLFQENEAATKDSATAKEIVSKILIQVSKEILTGCELISLGASCFFEKLGFLVK